MSCNEGTELDSNHIVGAAGIEEGCVTHVGGRQAHGAEDKSRGFEETNPCLPGGAGGRGAKEAIRGQSGGPRRGPTWPDAV